MTNASSLRSKIADIALEVRLLYNMRPMASQTLRLKLQAAAGAACFGLFLYAGWVKRWEPFHTYFYLFAWASFLWVIDRTLASRAGISPLSRPRSLARLLCLSTTFWLNFEVFNFRLSNWVYLNVPTERWLRWPGYALSFATVMPGILMVRKLVDSYLPRNSLPPGGRSEEHTSELQSHVHLV